MSLKSKLVEAFWMAIVVGFGPTTKEIEDEFFRCAMSVRNMGQAMHIPNFSHLHRVAQRNEEKITITEETIGNKTLRLIYEPIKEKTYYRHGEDIIQMGLKDPSPPDRYDLGYRGFEATSEGSFKKVKDLKGFILSLEEEGRRFPLAALAFKETMFSKFHAYFDIYKAQVDNKELRQLYQITKNPALRGMVEMVDHQLRIQRMPTHVPLTQTIASHYFPVQEVS